MTGGIHPTAEQDSPWYVVATKPRQESIAREHLISQGFRVLLPQIRLKKRRRNRWAEMVEPLFPGYLFVQLAFGRDDPAPIRSTRGCRDLVRFGEHHPSVPAMVLEQLTTQAASVSEGTPLFVAGESVRLEGGAFSGLTAVFDMPRGDDRALVLIQMLGNEHRVIVDYDQLTKNSE